jgi:hypothetical protein
MNVMVRGLSFAGTSTRMLRGQPVSQSKAHHPSHLQYRDKASQGQISTLRRRREVSEKMWLALLLLLLVVIIAIGIGTGWVGCEAGA